MLESLIAFAEWFSVTYGLSGAFLIAILESFIFPVPTSVFIAPMTTFGTDPLAITLVATAGSVIGAAIGYFLGYKLGRSAADRLFKKYMPRVEKWFNRWGAWAVLIAAFSPIPFKVFTWAAGIFKLDKKRFFIASIIGRLTQFAVAAYTGNILGSGIVSWLVGG